MKTLHRAPTPFETHSTRNLAPLSNSTILTRGELCTQDITNSTTQLPVVWCIVYRATRCLNVEEVYPLLGAPYKFATVARGGGAALPLITAFTPLPAYCLLTA